MRNHRRHDLRVQPGILAAITLIVAYGTGAWLQVLHHSAGAVEAGEPGAVAHWLRDSTLSLPLVAVAVWLGLLASRKLVRGASARPGFAAAITTTTIGTAATYVLVAGNPMHGLLFPAAESGHQHEQMSPLWHASRDALAALPVTLLLVGGLCAALLRLRPWEPVSPFTPRFTVRLAVPARRLAVVASTLLPIAIVVSSAPLAGAGPGAGRPCPSTAPVKTFSVKAVNVDIPLNKFGDHDPQGKMFVLADQLDEVRAQERSREVSVGLRDDPIQPLVIRANLGDCVEVTLDNEASGGDYGFRVDGMSFAVESSGDAIGNNTSSATGAGETRTYRFWVPRDKTFEGGHYIRPGAGHRDAIGHGLFGTLVAEPAGSKYLHPDTGDELRSGWEAMIVPGNGQKAFREYAEIMHEVGDENTPVMDRAGTPLPMVDPTTDAYRPGARAINYRSEPFMRRLERKARGKASAYSSFTFGDPATPQSRAYLGDPTKRRVVHGGSEMFHVYHLHGGGIRWRANPHADKTFDYQDTGLRKNPPASQSKSSRLDSQSMGPGESVDMQMEGGAGGVQQVAGEFLWHCHIAEHYVAGMWTFWRVFDTKQSDLRALPDRAAPPEAVDSAGLIGKTMPDGTTLTRDNLEQWIKPQLPAKGVPADDEDSTVWDWDTANSDRGPVYLGAPEDKRPWANNRPGAHPNAMPDDDFVGERPKIRFNPTNGRPAFPLLRPQIGQRPPFSPNGHSGAPWLGERGNAPKQGEVDPWAGRQDGICPSGAPTKRFNVVAIELPIKTTATRTDVHGKIFVLAKDKAAVLAGTKAPEPLQIRANKGECVKLTLANEQTDLTAADRYSKSSMHVHHVQFDTQASDGAVTGLSYEQAIRPYKTETKQLAAAAAAGDREIELTSTAGLRPGIDFAVDLGTDKIDIKRIESIDTATNTVTLASGLDFAHDTGTPAGVEFVQSIWFPDVQLDNVFWHDHVDGIHGWGHGMVGQIIIEPPGSTYHDPKTGEEIESGAIADIRTSNSTVDGRVEGSFREFAAMSINGNLVSDSTINLKAEPWSERLTRDADPSLLFSSWRHGDPVTPLPKAYAGDPVVIRHMTVGGTSETFRVEGHRFDQELRLPGTPKDTIVSGMSERFSLALHGGAGGDNQRTGDFLYHNGIARRFEQGAWGLMRVLPKRQVSDLQPLPGRPVAGGGAQSPTPTGGRPPVDTATDNPCPSGAPNREFNISAVDVGATSGFVTRTGPTATPPADLSPLVLHAAAGDCVTVNLRNERTAPSATRPVPRASFHVGEVDRTVRSSGVNAGFNPEQTVAGGQERTYRFRVDDGRIGSSVIADMGDPAGASRGLYGALIVAPEGAKFTDPVSGEPKDVGGRIDVQVPGGSAYRDMTVTLGDDDPVIGGDFTPYKVATEGPSTISGRANVRPVGAAMFSSRANGEPTTPTLTAYPGDPVKVHAIGAPGSEQMHVFSLGGLPWQYDSHIPDSQQVSVQALGPWSTIDADLTGGAGGMAREPGDFLYGDVRAPFTEAGMWGLMRVTSDSSCPVKPLPGRDCIGQKSLITDAAAPGLDTPAPAPAPAPAPQAEQPAGEQAPLAQQPSRRGVLGKPKAAKRMTLKALARNGLRLRVTVPERSRALEVVLSSTGKGKPVALRAVLRLPGGGPVSVVFKPTRAQVAKLRAGAYAIDVREGTARRRLGSEVTSTTIKLTGARVPAPAKAAIAP